MGHLHSRAAWLCVALHLSLSVGVSGLVLCVGEEGHVAIESRFAEDCCDDERRARDPVRLATRDDCNCTDASLLQPAAGVRVARGPALLGAVLSTVTVVSDRTRVVAERLGVTPGRVVNAGRGSPVLRALSTVVLRV